MPARSALWFVPVLFPAACGPVASPTNPPSSPGAASSQGPASTLVSGQLSLPAADAVGAPGFHEVLTVTDQLPDTLPSTAGKRLVLAVRDASRTGQTCSRDHPLSGCATADWSDDPARPKVPEGGVFENSLTLQFPTDPRSFFLSASGRLADKPDLFTPG